MTQPELDALVAAILVAGGVANDAPPSRRVELFYQTVEALKEERTRRSDEKRPHL